MKLQSFSTATALLLSGLLSTAGMVQAQESGHAPRTRGLASASANATFNMPSGSGEASTMTNGVPNLLSSNPQPGELGIQTRMTVRPRQVAATPESGDIGLRTMGAAPAVQVQPQTVD